MNKNTERVLAFVIRFKLSHDGNSPTVREIAEETGISSTSVVNYCLDKLEIAGIIQRDTGASRSIQVAGGAWSYQPQVRFGDGFDNYSYQEHE